MAGVPEKIVHYLLETRIDAHLNDGNADSFLEDFVLTHSIYVPANVLCKYLKNYYMQQSTVTIFEYDQDHRLIQLLAFCATFIVYHFFIGEVGWSNSPGN